MSLTKIIIHSITTLKTTTINTPTLKLTLLFIIVVIATANQPTRIIVGVNRVFWNPRESVLIARTKRPITTITGVNRVMQILKNPIVTIYKYPIVTIPKKSIATIPKTPITFSVVVIVKQTQPIRITIGVNRVF
jgi:hypothetical protein